MQFETTTPMSHLVQMHSCCLFLLKCNCECCVIIYKVLMDLWKVMGVVISTLNDGGIVNLKGYRWDLGSNLQSWIQSEFLNHILQATTLVLTLIYEFVVQVWGLMELQPPPQCSCLFSLFFSSWNLFFSYKLQSNLLFS